MLFYCVTEAGFRSGLMWVVFVLGSIAVPATIEDRVRNVAPFKKLGAKDRFPNRPLETASQRR